MKKSVGFGAARLACRAEARAIGFGSPRRPLLAPEASRRSTTAQAGAVPSRCSSRRKRPPSARDTHSCVRTNACPLPEPPHPPRNAHATSEPKVLPDRLCNLTRPHTPKPPGRPSSSRCPFLRPHWLAVVLWPWGGVLARGSRRVIDRIQARQRRQSVCSAQCIIRTHVLDPPVSAGLRPRPASKQQFFAQRCPLPCPTRRRCLLGRNFGAVV